MRILVTGANGFIGYRLVISLKEQGHDVLCHTRDIGDISSYDALDAFKNVDHVFHMAAKTFVPASWDHFYEYFQTNVVGTMTVLEYCRKNGCSLTMMSSYVYGQPKYLPIDENHPVEGMSPYHETKIICEELCGFYNRQFGVKITVLRPFNVYGKGQNADFLIPKIYRQAVDQNVKQIMVMNLTPKRDYVYIDDVVSALIATLHFSKQYSIYNVGSGVSTSVEDVILAVLKATGIQKPYGSTNQKRAEEVSDCVADISAIRRDLGYFPKYSLMDGLKAWNVEEQIKD